MRCDLFVEPEALQRAVAEHDMLLLCVAEPVALRALEVLDDHVRSEQVVVDICSVKSNICAAAQRLCRGAQYLSIHPMFGPDRGFDGHNMVGMTLRDGPAVASAAELFRSWGAAWLDTDSETHDQVTSVVQVMTHATLALFAHAREDLTQRVNAPPALVQAMATPIFAELSRVAEGMLRENPSLYHNIQTANPNGELARASLAQAAGEVLQTMGADDVAEVVDLFERLRVD